MTERRRKRPLAANHFGRRLSELRTRRRESQLSLALAANISQRHLSFVESGRTLPSRDMVVRLCDALDVPLRARNELLVSAGYAALYPERSLDLLGMDSVRDALHRMVSHHEPFPAFVVDRTWRVVMNNAGATRLVSACFDDATLRSLSRDGALNLMRMMFEPSQMRPRIRNWDMVGPRLLARLRNEARGDPNSPSMALLKELGPSVDGSLGGEGHDRLELPIVPVELGVGGATLSVQHDHDVRHAAGRWLAGVTDRDVLSDGRGDARVSLRECPERKDRLNRRPLDQSVAPSGPSPRVSP
jgi:transcriptional regulator with XRE-family HTH domain